MATLHDAFIDQLKDLYSAETQLTNALPKMAEAASEKKLRDAFEQHLEETRRHVERLDGIFDELKAKPGGETCEAMEGLVEEGEEAIEAFDSGPVRDAMLIASAQRVEHYEMAGYGTVRTWAKAMGHDSIADRLSSTLEEEKHADEKLNDIALDGVNKAAKSEH
jgi:ferritin-like metal-binding protein YciE